jgi:hypothetical protein
MLTTASLFLLFFQAGSATTVPAGRPNRICVGCVDIPVGEVDPREKQYDEQEFYRRFNRLATALTDFSKTYNSRGVIDVKKIKAIRKALRDFEKSDWFRQKAE